MKIMLFFLFGLIGITILKMLPDNRPKTRAAAAEKGFTAEEVERETPEITDDKTKLIKLVPDKCVKYTTSQFPGTDGDWSLLQRFSEDDKRLPNGFVVTGDRVTPELIEKLKPLAEKFGDEFYEFERRGPALSVFWWESGETRKVEELYQALSGLNGA